MQARSSMRQQSDFFAIDNAHLDRGAVMVCLHQLLGVAVMNFPVPSCANPVIIHSLFPSFLPRCDHSG